MDNIKIITEYLISLGFEITPYRIPLNTNEVFKSDLYYLISKKIPWLSKYLKKKIPIKYSEKIPNGDMWLVLRENHKAIVEISISKVSIDNCVVEIFSSDKGVLTFYIKLKDGYLKSIEDQLIKIDSLKSIIRNKKLTSLIND